ncbi:hypothetical protein D4764_17G0006180 [Takifugu flavidus]|uniref:Uncharacterized protein n=1 Tax=Takifugu flavidus TaxID=433684 RepID=A0A5C6NVY9_9TELE|nr:hypothetical protein D4764_17G0006180 [Takifugu flavidus]
MKAETLIIVVVLRGIIAGARDGDWDSGSSKVNAPQQASEEEFAYTKDSAEGRLDCCKEMGLRLSKGRIAAI